jgi:hypothetical protein
VQAANTAATAAAADHEDQQGQAQQSLEHGSVPSQAGRVNSGQTSRFLAFRPKGFLRGRASSIFGPGARA